MCAFFFSYTRCIGQLHSKCVDQRLACVVATVNPEISVAEYINAFLICTTWPTQVDRVQGWGVLHLLIQGPRLTKGPTT